MEIVSSILCFWKFKMAAKFSVFVVIFIFKCTHTDSIFLIAPEDVPTALVGIYGFAPKIVKGNDARVGFGFRLGNHADFQVLYEFGPQAVTKPYEKIRVRQTWSRQRARRRPFIEFLLRSGLLKEVRYNFSVTSNDDNDISFDEPR